MNKMNDQLVLGPKCWPHGRQGGERTCNRKESAAALLTSSL